jgi:hypothetical protein
VYVTWFAVDGGVDVCAKSTLLVVIETVRNKDRKRAANIADPIVFLFSIYTHK